MKALLLIGLIAGPFAALPASAASPFPWWFHTRPKPVLIDQPQTDRQPAPQPVAASTRPVQRTKPQPATQRQEPPAEKPWYSQFLARRTK